MTRTPIRRILCPVDFSEPSAKAFSYALALAQTVEAEVHVLHAYQLPIYTLPDGALIPPPDVAAAVSQDAQEALNALTAAAPKTVLISQHLTEGGPHDEVARLVEELDIDLVVVGTHGRTGLSHLLLGSVAERIVRSCPVPVISVPSRS